MIDFDSWLLEKKWLHYFKRHIPISWIEKQDYRRNKSRYGIDFRSHDSRNRELKHYTHLFPRNLFFFPFSQSIELCARRQTPPIFSIRRVCNVD